LNATSAGAAKVWRAGAVARGAAASLSGRAVIEAVLVLVGFGALAVIITWPIAADFSTRITGLGGGGDASGYVWDYWNLATNGFSLWGGQIQENVSAPFGRAYPGLNTTLLVSSLPGWLVAEAANPVAAYNVVALSGLALSGAAMYLLVRWLRLGVGPAIWAGVSFVLFPFELLRVQGHVPFAQLACFPLMIMAGLYWLERPGWRRAALLALGWLFSWLSNPYFGVMCGLMLAVFLAWGFIGSLRRASLRAALARVGEVAATASLIVVVPFLALFLSSRSAIEDSLTRDPIELVLYGARLDDYVRPPGSTPLWGEVFGSPFASPGGERLAYVGLGTLVLALIGGGAALLRRRVEMDPRRRAAALVCLSMVPVLLVFSLASPQTILGAELRFPSELIFDALPFFRGFARFVAAIMAALVVAGAVGLWMLVRRRGELVRVSVVVTAIMVAALDLSAPLPIASAEPVTVNGLRPEQVPTWAWLRDRPTDEIVFEMPGAPNELLERYFMYGQIVHGHPITNGNLFPGQIGHDFQKLTADPRRPNTAPWLASAGIDLLTISPWAYAIAGQAAPDPRTPPPGFALERTFADGSAVWRVTAAPADGVPIFRSETWYEPDYGDDGRLWRWMADEGRITAAVREPGRYRATFRAVGLPGAAYPLEIVAPDGSRRRVVVSGERDVSLEFAIPERTGEIVIRNLGPPARLISPGDQRIASLRMSEWELSRVR
jgi:hypothetical protein